MTEEEGPDFERSPSVSPVSPTYVPGRPAPFNVFTGRQVYYDDGAGHGSGRGADGDGRDEGEGEVRVILITPYGERYHTRRSCGALTRSYNMQRVELCQQCLTTPLQGQPLYKVLGPIVHMDAQHAWSASNGRGRLKVYTTCCECLQAGRRDGHDGCR